MIKIAPITLKMIETRLYAEKQILSRKSGYQKSHKHELQKQQMEQFKQIINEFMQQNSDPDLDSLNSQSGSHALLISISYIQTYVDLNNRIQQLKDHQNQDLSDQIQQIIDINTNLIQDIDRLNLAYSKYGFDRAFDPNEFNINIERHNMFIDKIGYKYINKPAIIDNTEQNLYCIKKIIKRSAQLIFIYQLTIKDRQTGTVLATYIGRTQNVEKRVQQHIKHSNNAKIRELINCSNNIIEISILNKLNIDREETIQVL